MLVERQVSQQSWLYRPSEVPGQRVCKLFLEERRKLGFPLMQDRSAAEPWVEQLAPKEAV